MKMNFMSSNFLTTSTMLDVSTGTATASYLFDRYTSTSYSTSGRNDDTLGATITVAFDATANVDRIILQGINLKGFKVYYNGNAANIFSLGSGCITSSSDFSQNSSTNLLLHWSTAIACTSVTIVCTTTISANEEKQIAQLIIGEKYLEFENNPDASNYKPKINRKEIVSEMSDGGTTLYILDEKFYADINLYFVSASHKVELKTVYDLWTEFNFIPFPTGTAWDGKIYEVVWIGDWNFEQYQDNFIDNGFRGAIKIAETPR